MSQFLKHPNEYSYDQSSGIDFDDAVKLPDGGSTCDIYKTRWQRRDVFVKRLKEQYRSKPLYLDALDKEFEIGAGLNHPALPHYLEFHRDFIVMDYVDGFTLAEMIKRKDPWLSDEKHIVQLLKELVNVVDYLHRHNIVHCDIKPDNIMITSNAKNLMLVDFDKSYTDALSDTSGHPGKYGLPADESGRVAIDFRGIAMVVEKLKAGVPDFRFSKFKQFVRACNTPDVNCEQLNNILDQVPSRALLSGIYLPLLISSIAILSIGLYYYISNKPSVDIATGNYPKPAIDSVIMTSEKSVAQKNDVPQYIHVKPLSEAFNIAPDIPEPKTFTLEKQNIPIENEHIADKIYSEEDIHKEAKKKAELLDERIKPNFDSLLLSLDNLKKSKENTTLTGQQLLDIARKHSDMADEYIAEAFAILNDMFKGLTDREAWRIMAYSRAYTGYTRRAGPELKEYRQVMERRFEEEASLNQ